MTCRCDLDVYCAHKSRTRPRFTNIATYPERASALACPAPVVACQGAVSVALLKKPQLREITKLSQPNALSRMERQLPEIRELSWIVSGGPTMIVKCCDKCKRHFDDTYRWTFCPHDTFMANNECDSFRHYHESYLDADPPPRGHDRTKPVVWPID